MSGLGKKEYKEKLLFSSACRGDEEYNSDTTTMVLILTKYVLNWRLGRGGGITQEIIYEFILSTDLFYQEMGEACLLYTRNNP